LHGGIASGKTEVYLAAAEQALAQQLRVLLVGPEISLTPQLVQRVRARLRAPIAILHSQLTELERAQQWWRVRRGQADVVLGSRSAVFAPIPRLGLICLDEEGSAAYKQDRTPRYETGWVARRLAAVTGARLVAGSATPSVVAYHAAQTGELALAKLTHRVRGSDAAVELVDMRDEFASGNRQPLSNRLLEAVDRSWPAARVLRLDSDVARGPDAYFQIWEAFSERRADILVGTQLVARGLDLPAVTCVGVVDADLPLHFPDYRSAENTFSLIVQ